MSKNLGLIFPLLVSLTLIGCGGGGNAAETGNSNEQQNQPASVAQSQQTQEGGLQQARGISRGDTTAPVVVHEFADFQCPACRMSATRLYPYLNRKYVQPGQVEYVFVDLPLTQIHNNAMPAHVAARCVLEQDKDAFWEMHDWLFEQQDQWAEADNPQEDFRGFVQNELSEVDVEQYQTCVEEQQPRETIQHNYQLARQLQVRGTPTFYVNGEEVYGAGQKILDKINEAVAAQQGTTGQGQTSSEGS